MKRFRSPHLRLLQVRRQSQRLFELALVRARVERDEAVRRRTAQQRRIRDEIESLAARLPGGMPVDLLRMQKLLIEELERQEAVVAAECSVHEQRVAEAAAQWTRASREVDVLEKLVSDQRRRHALESDTERMRDVDEQVLRQWSAVPATAEELMSDA